MWKSWLILYINCSNLIRNLKMWLYCIRIIGVIIVFSFFGVVYVRCKKFKVFKEFGFMYFLIFLVLRFLIVKLRFFGRLLDCGEEVEMKLVVLCLVMKFFVKMFIKVRWSFEFVGG